MCLNTALKSGKHFQFGFTYFKILLQVTFLLTQLLNIKTNEFQISIQIFKKICYLSIISSIKF